MEMEVEVTTDVPYLTRPISAAELIDALRVLGSLPDIEAGQAQSAGVLLASFAANAAFPPSLTGVLSTLSSALASAVAALLRVCRTGLAAVEAPASPAHDAGGAAAQGGPSGSPLTPSPQSPQTQNLSNDVKTASLSALEACTRFLCCLLQFCHEKNGVERKTSRWQLALMKTAEALHGELLELLTAPNAQGVQDAVVDLCEAALIRKWKGFAVLAPQFLPLMLANAIDSGSVAEIRRLSALKAHLLLFDFSDEASIVGLKTLMLQAAFAPAFLRSRDGRKFVAFLLTVPLVNQEEQGADLDASESDSHGSTLALVADVMAIIQNQIPSCRKSILKAYGSILLDAMLMLQKGGGGGSSDEEKGATARKLGELEDHVKSLGYTALYVRAEAVSKSIRTLLEIFHAPQTRKRSTVEGFLYRLWAPHIFRALSSPNENVRRRGAQIFAEIFPFDDPDASEETAAQDACRQLEALTALSDDPAPSVRMVAAGAAGRALALVWELLLPVHRDVLLSGLMKKLARDSSAAVRVAAVQAVGCIVRNPLAQHLLKKRLADDFPRLLRDRSPAVRASMAQLLETVADTQHIQFFDVASDEDILDCLCYTAVSTEGRLQGKIALDLVSLLLPSVFPAPPSEGEAADDDLLAQDIATRVLEVVKAHGSAAAVICQAAVATGNSAPVLLRTAARLIEMAWEQASPVADADKSSEDHAKRLKTEMCVPAALAAAASIVESAMKIKDHVLDDGTEDVFDLDLIARAAQLCGCDRCLCQAFRICAAMPPSLSAEAIIELTTRVVGRAEAARFPVLQAMVHLTRSWGGYEDFAGHLKTSLDRMLAQSADAFEDRETLESLVGLVRMLLAALESSASTKGQGESPALDSMEREWIAQLERVKPILKSEAFDDPALDEIVQTIDAMTETGAKLLEREQEREIALEA